MLRKCLGTKQSTGITGSVNHYVSIFAEIAMHSDADSNLPVSDQLPRQLYWIIVALAVWLVASVWGFTGKGYTELALTVVSLFLGVAVGLPLVLELIARRYRSPHSGRGAAPLVERLARPGIRRSYRTVERRRSSNPGSLAASRRGIRHDALCACSSFRYRRLTPIPRVPTSGAQSMLVVARASSAPATDRGPAR